jgi:hypothetical protein
MVTDNNKDYIKTFTTFHIMRTSRHHSSFFSAPFDKP